MRRCTRSSSRCLYANDNADSNTARQPCNEIFYMFLQDIYILSRYRFYYYSLHLVYFFIFRIISVLYAYIPFLKSHRSTTVYHFAAPDSKMIGKSRTNWRRIQNDASSRSTSPCISIEMIIDHKYINEMVTWNSLVSHRFLAKLNIYVETLSPNFTSRS